MLTRTLRLAVALAIITSLDLADARDPTLAPIHADLLDGSSQQVHAALRSEVFREGFRWQRGLSEDIEIYRHQRSDSNAAWIAKIEKVSLGFRPTALATRRGGDEILVAGVKDDGATIIERIRFRWPDGVWISGTDSIPLVGEAQVPDYGPSQLHIKGDGPFREAAVRAAIRLSRETLFEGTTLGHVQSLALEPEGRFALVLVHAPKALWRFELGAGFGGPPTLVLDTVACPAIGQVRKINTWIHAVDQRTYVLRACRPLTESQGFVLLTDLNNDAVLSSEQVLTQQQWTASDRHKMSSWSDLDLWDLLPPPQ